MLVAGPDLRENNTCTIIGINRKIAGTAKELLFGVIQIRFRFREEMKVVKDYQRSRLNICPQWQKKGRCFVTEVRQLNIMKKLTFFSF